MEDQYNEKNFDEYKNEIYQKINILKEKIIKQLIREKNISLNWTKGISKYISITYSKKTNQWKYKSIIFDESKWFNTQLEAETFAENICKEYNISLEYITRKGYDKQNDNEEVII
jgi:hypothetical protein